MQRAVPSTSMAEITLSIVFVKNKAKFKGAKINRAYIYIYTQNKTIDAIFFKPYFQKYSIFFLSLIYFFLLNATFSSTIPTVRGLRVDYFVSSFIFEIYPTFIVASLIITIFSLSLSVSISPPLSTERIVNDPHPRVAERRKKKKERERLGPADRTERERKGETFGESHACVLSAHGCLSNRVPSVSLTRRFR